MKKKKPERNSALTVSRASRTRHSKQNRKHHRESVERKLAPQRDTLSISPSPRRSPPRRTIKRSPSSRRRASRTPDKPTLTRTATGRSLSRKASRRSPSCSEYRNPSPRRNRTTDRSDDYYYDYRPSPEYQTPDSSPTARRRANLYSAGSARTNIE